MKIGKDDLLAIEAGTDRTFECKDGKQCESVRQQAYRINNLNPLRGIRLKASMDWLKSTVKITAIECEVPQLEKANG